LGQALRQLTHAQASGWKVFGPETVFSGGPSTGGLSLGTLPERVDCAYVEELQLVVPLRTFRTPAVSTWVTRVLDGDAAGAFETATAIAHYPILLTRSLGKARDWLKKESRGHRRYGLLASSGARRLRAEGLGVLLSAADGSAIAHWYLNPVGDIRSSFALEVPANEYTSQGLEIDFATVCWGGDMLYDSTVDRWRYSSLGGTRWKEVNREERQRFIKNSYRVLLTRAREGMVLWVSQGSAEDATRSPEALDATAAFLQECGAVSLDST
jgi:hypothetical protein